MEHQSSNGKLAMEEELIKGRDIANQLLDLLAHKSNTHHRDVEGLILPFAEDLIHKILGSFTNTISLLNTNNNVSDKEVVPVTITSFSSSAICRKPEDTNDPCKIFFNARNRKGCYKRRSTAPTWEKDSPILIEDGYAWRKYGHKMIMNAKYPRSYYRCTHKCDQGCPAIKKVQRIKEDPPLYRTTYFGHHICNSSLSDSETNLEPASNSLGSSIFLSFNNSLPSKEEYPFSSTLFAASKQEPMEEVPNDHIARSLLPSPDDLLLCDYELDFDYERHVTMLSSAESIQFGF